MGSIFKAYDIRGIYGKDLDEKLAEKIGRAFATFLKPKKVVIGHDMRPHSVPLFKALASGLMQQGVQVINIGLCSTPMSYYANGKLGADGSIMLTASHNPGEWNGFKLCREKAIPLSGVTGIKDIEKIVLTGAFAPASGGGKMTDYDIMPEYGRHIRGFADLKRTVHVAVDFANAMGIVENKTIDSLIKVDPLFDTLDGTFPNHEANPLLPETFEAISHKVKKGKYDFAIYYDGDADRCGFTDEKGQIIPMDMITALIAEMMLAKNKGATIFYDLRSSWAVKELIVSCGGKPMMSRVGHAFIKQQMRENNAVFAGELSGHYYFKENYFAESSSLAALYIANLVSQSDKTLSELVKPVQKYFASGEINSEVENTREVLEHLKSKYRDGSMIELDGLSVEYKDWWFNVRASNTEPLIRLNLEAKSRGQMEAKRDELLAVIRG